MAHEQMSTMWMWLCAKV